MTTTSKPIKQGTKTMSRTMQQEKEMAGLHVVLIGNPRDGFRVIGPFKTGAEAQDYVDYDPLYDWMIAMPLDAPAEATC